MATPFKLSIMTPEGVVYEGEVASLVFPAEEGYWGVWAGHMPAMVKLKRGKVRVKEGGGKKEWEIKGGFAWVERDRVLLMVDI